tara:strand:+ start:222 stop:548 length:327 start_codon:yes stop_codon:yes gene_type:complete
MVPKLRSTQAAMAVLRVRDETFQSYDEMIGDGNADVNATVHAAINSLTAQNAVIEQGVVGLGLGPIGVWDSLDNPAFAFECPSSGKLSQRGGLSNGESGSLGSSLGSV